jgi:hypothetical protein
MLLFRKGQLRCPRGHHVKESDFLIDGHGAVYCDKKTPSTGSRGERSHEGPCGTVLYIIAGFRTFDGDEPLRLRLAVEVTPSEMRHIAVQALSIVAASEFLGLVSWTRR